MASARTPGGRGRASTRRADLGGDVVGIDNPAYRAELAENDKALNRAYKGGQAEARHRLDTTRGPAPAFRRHSPAQVHEDESHQGAHEQGFGDTISDARRSAMRSSGAGKGSRNVVDESAGIVLGLLAYALFINYARGGWPGVRKWISAKFINNESGTGADISTPGATLNGGFFGKGQLYTGPTGSHIVQTPHGATIEPNPVPGGGGYYDPA